MQNCYSAIVVGVSAGGLKALSVLLPGLPAGFSVPIAIVQHLRPERGEGFMIKHLNSLSRILIKEADEKESLLPGVAYIAPPDHHLHIEQDRTFGLSVDPPVNYARPSIDVLFESAACVYENELIGIVLTGANNDGAAGLVAVKQRGGLTVVEDPATAKTRTMPQAALEAAGPDYIRSISDIPKLLTELVTSAQETAV